MEIELFTSDSCVRCPQVKEMLKKILGEKGLDFAKVVKMRDIQKDPEAMTDLLMVGSYATPTVKKGDKMLAGEITEKQLRELVGD